MSKSIKNACRAAACGVAAFVPSSQALEPSDVLLFNLGPVSLRPQLNLDTQYNDNVFYRDVNKEADLVTMISPGLKAQIGSELPEENKASIQYTLNQILYLDRTDQNATQHRFATDLRYATERVTLTGRDRVEFLSSVLGGGFGITGEKVDRLVITDVWQLGYDFTAKTGVYGRIEHTDTDFEDTIRLYDRQRFEGTLGFDFRYTDRTAFFGEAFYGTTLIGQNAQPIAAPDSTFYGGFIGARGQFTDRFTARVKAGWEETSFDDGTPGGGGPAAEAALTFQATDRLTLGLNYVRRQQVSVQFDRSAYVSDAVTLTAAQILGSTGRLRLSANATYEMFEFEPTPRFPDRSDTMIGFEVAATWFFQTWLAARLAYAFEDFSSNLPATSVVDYTVNRVTLSLAIGF